MEYNTKLVIQKMKLARYSPRTIKAYCMAINKLATFYKTKNIENLSNSEIEKFLVKKIDQKLSDQSISVYANAINYLYLNIYKKQDYVKLRHQRRISKLPVVLSKAELEAIFDTI